MTRFEPEVAYRILTERQQRYFDRQGELIREKSWFSVRRMLPPWVEQRYEREIRWYEAEAHKMWDVLYYLRTRIEEGS